MNQTIKPRAWFYPKSNFWLVSIPAPIHHWSSGNWNLVGYSEISLDDALKQLHNEYIAIQTERRS